MMVGLGIEDGDEERQGQAEDGMLLVLVLRLPVPVVGVDNEMISDFLFGSCTHYVGNRVSGRL